MSYRDGLPRWPKTAALRGKLVPPTSHSTASTLKHTEIDFLFFSSPFLFGRSLLWISMTFRYIFSLSPPHSLPASRSTPKTNERNMTKIKAAYPKKRPLESHVWNFDHRLVVLMQSFSGRKEMEQPIERERPDSTLDFPSAKFL